MVDGVSLTIIEIKHLGSLDHDVVKLTCNVHHADIDQENIGVILFRALWNKFCYSQGEIQSEVTLYHSRETGEDSVAPSTGTKTAAIFSVIFNIYRGISTTVTGIMLADCRKRWSSTRCSSCCQAILG